MLAQVLARENSFDVTKRLSLRDHRADHSLTAAWQVSKELATGHLDPTKPRSSSDFPLSLFPMLLHLLSSPVLRAATVSDGLIADLAAYLAASAHTSVQDLAGLAEFQVVPKHTHCTWSSCLCSKSSHVRGLSKLETRLINVVVPSVDNWAYTSVENLQASLI